MNNKSQSFSEEDATLLLELIKAIPLFEESINNLHLSKEKKEKYVSFLKELKRFKDKYEFSQVEGESTEHYLKRLNDSIKFDSVSRGINVSNNISDEQIEYIKSILGRH